MDESIYEFEGKDCDVKRFIKRKPHPNGLLVYGLAGYILVDGDRIPFLLDLEPYTMDNQVSAQDAMLAMHTRLRIRHPYLQPYLSADSAFGSFEKIAQLQRNGMRSFTVRTSTGTDISRW